MNPKFVRSPKSEAEKLFDAIDDIALSAGSIFGLPTQGMAHEDILALIAEPFARIEHLEKIVDALDPTGLKRKEF